jgi:hypothetical protein
MGIATLNPYMVSSRIARRCVLNDFEQVAAIYPASVWEGLDLPGLDVIRAYRPHQPIGVMSRWVSQVFNTPV